MTKELLQQALDVLCGCLDHPDAADIIAALESAIAQPVQPAPERNKHWHDTAWARGHAMGMIANQAIARSATQALEAEREAHMETNRMMTEALMQAEANIAQPVPLTDEALFSLLVGIDSETKRLPPGFKQFARAIEAAHGIVQRHA